MKQRIVAAFLCLNIVLSNSMGVSAAELEQGTDVQAAVETETQSADTVEIPKANVMDVDFSTGEATDQSELKNSNRVVGNPTIETSDELHKTVAHFDGSSAYVYPFDDTKYENIKEEVTIECMFKYDSIPSSGETDMFSNQQSGGIGLGTSSGKLTFFAHVGGGYKEPKATIPAGRWVHAVGVVDGESVVDALKETGTYDETLIIANADHGGSGTGHGSTDPSNMDVFIGIGGQTVNSGQRLEGGDNSDIAAIALEALRIEKPESMTGEVFDANTFLSQEEMSKKNRDIEKITFTKTGKSATLSLSNPKSETRVVDAVIDLDGAQVKKVDAGDGTILRQEVEDGQLKLTVSYDSQPEKLAKITFDRELSAETSVDEIMLGTSEGKEVYPDLENTTAALTVDKNVLNETIQAAQDLQANDYTASSWADVTDALKNAQAVTADSLAEQEEIDAATQQLEAAMNALEKALDATYRITNADAENGTVEYVKANDKTATSVTIPDTVTIDGITYKVTSIAANAFENNRNIKEVTIGDNVKVIGLRAFANCIYLKKVTMGKSVSVLVYKAFYNCVSLTDLTMPDNEMKIGEYAFYGCKYLRKINYYQNEQ